MKTLYASFTGEHWQINFHQDGHHYKNGGHIPLSGKQNSFRNRTDAENCIRAMVKSNPKLYKFNEL